MKSSIVLTLDSSKGSVVSTNNAFIETNHSELQRLRNTPRAGKVSSAEISSQAISIKEIP